MSDESLEKIITPFLDNMTTMVNEDYFNRMSLSHIFDLSEIDYRGSVSLETAEPDREYIKRAHTLAAVDLSLTARAIDAAILELPTENQQKVDLLQELVEDTSEGGFELIVILHSLFPGNTAMLLL